VKTPFKKSKFKENFVAHACSLLQLSSNMPNREQLQTAFQQFFAEFENALFKNAFRHFSQMSVEFYGFIENR
jgi:hypothetical protein